MGEHGRAVALLWLEHGPSIGLAIGPRQLHPAISNSKCKQCHKNVAENVISADF